MPDIFDHVWKAVSGDSDQKSTHQLKVRGKVYTVTLGTESKLLPLPPTFYCYVQVDGKEILRRKYDSTAPRVTFKFFIGSAPCELIIRNQWTGALPQTAVNVKVDGKYVNLAE